MRRVKNAKPIVEPGPMRFVVSGPDTLAGRLSLRDRPSPHSGVAKIYEVLLDGKPIAERISPIAMDDARTIALTHLCPPAPRDVAIAPGYSFRPGRPRGPSIKTRRGRGDDYDDDPPEAA